MLEDARIGIRGFAELSADPGGHIIGLLGSKRVFWGSLEGDFTI